MKIPTIVLKEKLEMSSPCPYDICDGSGIVQDDLNDSECLCVRVARAEAKADEYQDD
jgi:hypothetical protein